MKTGKTDISNAVTSHTTKLKFFSRLRRSTERMTRPAGAAPHEARRDGERWVDCLGGSVLVWEGGVNKLIESGIEQGGREGECEMWVGNKAGTYNAAKKASASKPSTPIR
jgi:hypothetical protein